jgi:Helicase associated domain
MQSQESTRDRTHQRNLRRDPHSGAHRPAPDLSLQVSVELDDNPITLTPIQDSSGKVLSDSLFTMNLPKHLTESMLHYVKTRNICDLCLDLLGSSSRVADQHVSGNQVFDIRRPFGPRITNMHWIAPSNEATLFEIIRNLGSGGFGKVLQVFGDYFPHINKLVCYEISFLTVSSCNTIRRHADLNGNNHTAWNVLFPLVLVNNSVDELIVFSDDKKHSKHIKYNLGTAIVLGDGGIHATNLVQYAANQYRLMMSVYVADISVKNAPHLMEDASHMFPGSVKDILEMAKRPNWTRESGLHMPTIPLVELVGREWYQSFQQLKQFQQSNGHCFITNEDDPVLSAWAYKQREFYIAMHRGQRSKGMTENRARLLTSIGFVFVLKQTEGKNSVAWDANYQALVQYKQLHGHCNVTPKHKIPSLLNWVRNQRKALKKYNTGERKHMSDQDIQRAQQLQRIGFRWKA